MGWLFENVLFQEAVVAFLMIVLVSAGKWVKSKLNPADLVNDNWEYVLPVIAGLRKQAAEMLKGERISSSEILQKQVVAFIDNYRNHEYKEPSEKLISAVRNELEQALGYALKKGV